MSASTTRLAKSIDTLTPAVILEIGREVIATEADALWALEASLDQSFVDTIQAMHVTKGRVIVCALGKSGHVAGKLAATLMATGTPACFLHAGDAIHGDLGVMMAGDLLLILSNSGDTREFGVIIRHARALALRIIVVSSHPASAAARAADIALILPPAPEACPLGSSPSTSTTLMMALGDALAFALMRAHGAGAADLLALHPGGRLGLDLIAVRSFMHHPPALPLVAPDMAMDAVLALISDKGFGVAGVADHESRLLGIITDGDIRRHVHDLTHATAADVMTRRPRTLTADAVAREALALMTQSRITSLFVLDAIGGRIAGLVHIHDLLCLGIA